MIKSLKFSNIFCGRLKSHLIMTLRTCRLFVFGLAQCYATAIVYVNSDEVAALLVIVAAVVALELTVE